MNGVTPADLRANPWRVAVTQDGTRVRYHVEMGHQFEHDGEWVMICGTFMDSLDWPARWEHQMINPETDPWKHLDAVRAANLAVLHWEAKKKFQTDKSSKNAEEMVALQGIREDHQKKTGWVAEHQGEGEWVFTYMEPGVRFAGGQVVTITAKEGRAENI